MNQRVTTVRPVIETDNRYGRTPENIDLSDHWLTYQDAAAVGGVQRFSITVQGRSLQRGARRAPWAELVRKGDFVWVDGHNWTGASDSSRTATLADGLIVDVQESETIVKDTYEFTTTFVCESILHILARDAVAWWTYFGSSRGLTRARAELPLQEISGRLDKVVSNYLERVAFTSEIWERDGLTLGDRLAYSLTSLAAHIPPRLDLTVAEGTHYAILQQHVDVFHQLYAVTLPTADLAGRLTRPATHLRGDDRAATTLVLRPAPFPYANPDGSGDTSEWSALTLHDHTSDPNRPIGARTASESLLEHYNFFLVAPNSLGLTDRVALAAGVAVANPTARRYFAHAPLRVNTPMLRDEASDDTVLDTARALTWRLAGQYNRLEDYASGSVMVPFNPKLLPGDRIRFRAPHGDGTRILEAYVQARTHSLTREEGGATTVQYERGLPAELYGDPAWFVEGLEQVDLSGEELVTVTDGLSD